LHPNRIRDFASNDFLPFVKSVGWDQAALFLQCLSIRGRRINRLGTRIDRFERIFRILRPIQNQCPLERVDGALSIGP
jgi:hypothetical protein